jgi:amino acid transporter
MSWTLTAGTPLMVVAGVMTEGYAVTGVTGQPIAFILVGVVLGVFCLGYTAMTAHVQNAGALYAYIAGASRRLAIGAAWLATAGYCVLQVALYGAVGAAVRPLAEQYAHVSPPWLLLALIVWAITAVSGAYRVDLTGRLLGVLALAELAIISVYGVMDLADPSVRRR